MSPVSILRRRNRQEVNPLRHVDRITIIIYLLMVVAGAISIYAASYDFDNASIFSFDEFSGKQLRWVGLSLVVGLIILLVDWRVYETYAWPIYIAITLILAATPLLAHDIKGSLSWISLGPMSIQPAEFGKFATALALAKLFSGYNFQLNAKPMNYVKSLVIILLPFVLILLQKETGSALVYISLFFVLYREGMSGLVLLAALISVIIFVFTVKFTEIGLLGLPIGEFIIYLLIMALMSGMLWSYSRRRKLARNVSLGFITIIAGSLLTAHFTEFEIPWHWIFTGAIGSACLYSLFELLRDYSHKLMVTIGTIATALVFMFSVSMFFNQVLEPHQQMRIKVLLGIEEDLRGAGYNVNQSMIAIGSGGLSGKGFLQGTQTKLKFVPEQHTDFIYCTIGEEEGFAGSIAVIVMFVALILRIIHLAERQPTVFGRVYAYCVASYFIFHVCINLGMVIGLCPVIGIPLPFFSYGGSSLWGFTILLFILLRIDAARRDRHGGSS